MIALSGLKYKEDIDIVFTGIRPGEKLFEELFYPEEEGTKKVHDKIFRASRDLSSLHQIKADVVNLESAVTRSPSRCGPTAARNRRQSCRHGNPPRPPNPPPRSRRSLALT